MVLLNNSGCASKEMCNPLSIIIETFVRLVLGILGASLNGPALKEIRGPVKCGRGVHTKSIRPLSPLTSFVVKLTKWIPDSDMQTILLGKET